MRKYIYKMAVFAIALACLSITVKNDSYAGTINANEAELMGIIRGTFVYEGVSYVGDPSYINEAYYYFLRDDIEVTDSQKASAIKEMFSRIPEGISKGYLIPVGGKPAGVDEETSSEQESSSNSSEIGIENTNTNQESKLDDTSDINHTNITDKTNNADQSNYIDKITSMEEENSAGEIANAGKNTQKVPIYEEETAMVETQEAKEIISGDTVFYPAWSVKPKETQPVVLNFEALPVKKLESYQSLEELMLGASFDYEGEEIQEISERLQQLSAGFLKVSNWIVGILGIGLLVNLGTCLRLKLFYHKKEKRGKHKHV